MHVEEATCPCDLNCHILCTMDLYGSCSGSGESNTRWLSPSGFRNVWYCHVRRKERQKGSWTERDQRKFHEEVSRKLYQVSQYIFRWFWQPFQFFSAEKLKAGLQAQGRFKKDVQSDICNLPCRLQTRSGVTWHCPPKDEVTICRCLYSEKYTTQYQIFWCSWRTP